MSIKTREEKQAHIRTCIGCGNQYPKYRMLRIVRNPDGEVGMDKSGNADGRGCYFCRDIACYEKAVKKNNWARFLNVDMIPVQLKEKIMAEISGSFE